LERGAQTRETIMAMLRRHPAGLTTADIADALGQPGHTSMVAPHLKHLRADGRVIPGPRGRCAVNGGRRWMAIENPPA
jgi:predicted ArsR family transcriptional regulator